jgi:hypothetical protein
MNDNDILKALEDLFVIVLMLENLKKRVSKRLHFYINEIEKDALVSFNLIYEKFERSLQNAS